MRRTDLVVIGTRLALIWLMATAAADLLGLLLFAGRLHLPEDALLLAVLLAEPIVPIVFAVVVWTLAPWLAGRLLEGGSSGADDGGLAVAIDARQIVLGGMIVAGVVTTAMGLGRLLIGVYSTVWWYSEGREAVESTFIAAEPVEPPLGILLMASVQIAAGLILMFGGRKILALVERVRGDGALGATGEAR